MLSALESAAVRLPFVRTVLVVLPLVMAARLASTALWSAPSGPRGWDDPAVFDTIYWTATGLAVVWAVISRTRLRWSLYIGCYLSLLCGYRAVTLWPARETFGSVANTAMLNWATFSIMTLTGTILSVQYIYIYDQIQRARRGENSPIGSAAVEALKQHQQDVEG